eukprot:COSAG01_NODE_3609_length_5876_cov_70.248572_1_plen_218_part_00
MERPVRIGKDARNVQAHPLWADPSTLGWRWPGSLRRGGSARWRTCDLSLRQLRASLHPLSGETPGYPASEATPPLHPHRGGRAAKALRYPLTLSRRVKSARCPPRRVARALWVVGARCARRTCGRRCACTAAEARRADRRRGTGGAATEKHVCGGGVAKARQHRSRTRRLQVSHPSRKPLRADRGGDDRGCCSAICCCCRAAAAAWCCCCWRASTSI